MAPVYHYPDIGTLGEDLVAQWLIKNGWKILHRRWKSHLRGEIDIIAESKNTTQDFTLAFVEVKTRSAGNWDSGGRDAVELSKQAKILRTAKTFLAQNPDKADYCCRFDVAIVSCQQKSQLVHLFANINQKLQPGISLQEHSGYYLILQEYIVGAFDSLGDW
jgi:putative endonuclease